jgi:hypothetical protein
MVEYIPSYSGPAEHWGLLPATRLASREILTEQNIKKRTGPSLCVLCGGNKPDPAVSGLRNLYHPENTTVNTVKQTRVGKGTFFCLLVLK